MQFWPTVKKLQRFMRVVRDRVGANRIYPKIIFVTFGCIIFVLCTDIPYKLNVWDFDYHKAEKMMRVCRSVPSPLYDLAYRIVILFLGISDSKLTSVPQSLGIPLTLYRCSSVTTLDLMIQTEWRYLRVGVKSYLTIQKNIPTFNCHVTQLMQRK